MGTPYKTIYKAFSRRIEDKDLPKFTKKDQSKILLGWLDDALAYIELEGLKIKNSFEKDDEIEEFVSNLDRNEIVLVSMYMVVAWYESKINSLEHTLLFVTSKDEKWESQKNHLDMMMKAQEDVRLRARKLFRGWGLNNNPYLKD